MAFATFNSSQTRITHPALFNRDIPITIVDDHSSYRNFVKQVLGEAGSSVEAVSHNDFARQPTHPDRQQLVVLSYDKINSKAIATIKRAYKHGQNVLVLSPDLKTSDFSRIYNSLRASSSHRMRYQVPTLDVESRPDDDIALIETINGALQAMCAPT